MRSPLTYYGGKSLMADGIVAAMPPHKIYVEPFAGGASVFFRKGKSQAEYLNDINGNIANLYQVMKSHFTELQELIENTIHCEHTHSRACQIYQQGGVDPITQAWATWVAINLSFSGQAAGSFGWAKNNRDAWSPPVATRNKKNQFQTYINRLENVTIFNRDALDIIRQLDSPDTYFYLDPPYVGARQGHYAGYTQKHFDSLLSVVEKIEGKFTLSSYHNTSLQAFKKINKWHQTSLDMRLGVSQTSKRKTEVLTYNYSNVKTLFHELDYCTTTHS